MNIFEIKKIITFLSLSAVIFFVFVGDVKAENTKNYFVKVNYHLGTATFGDVYTRESGAVSSNSGIVDDNFQYIVKLVSYDGEVIEEEGFNMVIDFSYSEINEKGEEVGKMVKEKHVEHLQVIPYHIDGARLMLYDANKHLIDQKDISSLAETCGDGKCAEYENYLLCKKDCSPDGEDGFCNGEQADKDPDCRVSENEKNEKNTLLISEKSIKNSFFIPIVVVFVIIIVFIVMFFIRNKQRNQE